MIISAIWYSGTEPVEVTVIGVLKGVEVIVEVGDTVGVGVGVCVVTSVGVEVNEGEDVGVGVMEVGVGVEVAVGDNVVTGVAVETGVAVAVEVGAKANGSITTRTIKVPKVKGLAKLLSDTPENELLVPIELSNKRVSLASPLASITIKKLPESTTFKLEISKLFQLPVPTVEVVDIGGTISLEKLETPLCV